MPILQHDGIDFHYCDVGAGIPFIFQHGLGADLSQPCGLFKPPAGIRLLSFDCRGHGQTHPLGPEAGVGIAPFADDLVAIIDRLRIDRAIVGGISMGAAVALNVAVRFPRRVLGLIVSRPAWLYGPRVQNTSVYGFIARLIRQHGARRAQEVFRTTPEYEEALRLSPDVAGSLLRQFENPRIEEVVVLLERIPRDQPAGTLTELQSIRTPTLVLANRQDPIHPFEFGTALADAIPGAEFRELTSKSVDRERHNADTQRCIADFLQRRFLA